MLLEILRNWQARGRRCASTAAILSFRTAARKLSFIGAIDVMKRGADAQRFARDVATGILPVGQNDGLLERNVALVNKIFLAAARNDRMGGTGSIWLLRLFAVRTAVGIGSAPSNRVNVPTTA
jgi:hypothetical protein